MKDAPAKKNEEKNGKYFPVVAIGASAGGIKAFIELLSHLPLSTGMSYIYIQHLDPEHESHLPEIFARANQMPVLEAKEALKIKPDHVYVIPPNRVMTLVDHTLKLSLRPVRPQSHLPINDFFISLAEEYKEKAVGVLLSGNPPDGTLGLKAIKAAGGITFAQDSTAQFNGMPKNAIAEDVVDLVLSPQRIGEELGKLSEQQEKYENALNDLSEETISNPDENLLNVIRQIHRLTGVDFSHYKITTIKRRIVRRMILHKVESLYEYVQYLKHHTAEVQALYKDLLINVTTFFRESEAYDYLRKTLFPKILKLKAPGEVLRIWVPACSSGQEAYSLAILLMEVLGEKAATTSLQIFATDLSEMAVNKARLGIYSKDEIADIPTQRLTRFFTKIDGIYRIIKSIRDLCVFATHNVLKDPPFSRLDFISCCNLLIYMEPVLQKKMMATFHYSLNPTGYLMVGKAETIGSSGHLFNQVDKKYKIFTKKKDAAAKALFELTYRSYPSDKESNLPVLVAKIKGENFDLDRVVDGLLLKKYTPACVVVNQELDIIQFRGSTGLFLEPAPGKASLNLLKMARPGLGFELRNIVHKASRSGEPESKWWEETGKEKTTKKISVEAIPLKYNSESTEKYFLVLFSEESLEAKPVQKGENSSVKRVKQLEDELHTLREDMRSLLEDQEAGNEELQSVNEEIISSNEELQSINEELETSKEELESSNEELLTINQEMQMRNEQLAEIQEYSEAVFTTIRESLLILDKNLRIKNANSKFYQTFEVSEEETEGKLLYELGNHQWNIPRLKELLEEVIPRNSMVSDFEVVHHFPHIGEKIMMLNARRLVQKLHGEQLVLVAIEDITEYRQAQRLLAEKEEWFRNMANNSPMMIWVTDVNKKIEFVNEAWLDYRDKTKEEVIGESWIEEDIHGDDVRVAKKKFEDSFDRKKEFTLQYRLKKGKDYKLLLSKGAPNYSGDGKFTGFIGSCVEMPKQLIGEK